MVTRTCTASRPSSSSFKPKTGRFKRCKSFIHKMGGCYGLLFGHLVKTFMPRKNFNELSEMLYQALKEILPSMVNDVVANHIPLQYPLYLTMKNDEQLQNKDLPIWLSLKIKFKKITTATPYRTSAIRPRDHEDHQDDDARPEGESSTKRQKTSEYGTYTFRIEDDVVPAKEVSQELLEEMSMEIDEAQLQKL
ncbi:hypothetical protein Tco_0516117 [Tanacetum coccineum]